MPAPSKKVIGKDKSPRPRDGIRSAGEKVKPHTPQVIRRNRSRAPSNSLPRLTLRPFSDMPPARMRQARPHLPRPFDLLKKSRRAGSDLRRRGSDCRPTEARFYDADEFLLAGPRRLSVEHNFA